MRRTSSPHAVVRPRVEEAPQHEFLLAARLLRTRRTTAAPTSTSITGGEGTFPHVTQSETQIWAKGNTVVSAYNDSQDSAQLLLRRLLLHRTAESTLRT